jgi:hypothetical protein
MLVAVAIFCLLCAMFLVVMTLRDELSQENTTKAKRKVPRPHGHSALWY